ncbi:hypothetical protein B566_EDAN018042, partial [Ephemera danica]
MVIAGIGDLQRPADQLSVKQYSSLAVTGFIWARYCLVIIPKNYSLCAVNFFVGLTGLYQVSRAMLYQRSLVSTVPGKTRNSKQHSFVNNFEIIFL